MSTRLAASTALLGFIAVGCSTKATDVANGGADAGADALSPLTFAPAGCMYSITPPDSRGFLDQATDDAMAAGSAPTRVRIGLGGGTTSGQAGYADPTTTAVFTWETADATHASKVRLGNDPATLADVHAGYSFTTPPPTIGIGQEQPPANMHEAHVCGLTPGKTYYYQVGGGTPEVWSATQTFTTVPATGPLKIGISGDSRDSADIFQMVQLRMRDAAVAMQLYSGDAVIAGTDQALFAAFLDKAWKDPSDATKFLTLGQQMIVPVAGNHENESSQFYGNFAIPGDGPNAETYASFDLGTAHVVLLDDQSIAFGLTPASTDQLAWVDQDLTRAEKNRANVPFLVVLHHRGELSTSMHELDSDVVTMRNALMPIWDKHHVDLVLNGHDHNYERSKPATGPASAPMPQTAANAGTTYVVCAGAGASGYTPGATAVSYREKNVGFGAGLAGSPNVGVYGILTIDGKKLTFNAYGVKASSKTVADDDVIDTFELSR